MNCYAQLLDFTNHPTVKLAGKEKRLGWVGESDVILKSGYIPH
jgi:hypothetical protein